MSLATFYQFHSNAKEVPYLIWQNKYSNLKIVFHIKLKFFLQTKHLESVLFVKYFISVTVAPNRKTDKFKWNENFLIG